MSIFKNKIKNNNIQPESKKCTWYFEIKLEGLTASEWLTSCWHSFNFANGDYNYDVDSVKDCGFVFCPWCGKRIRVEKDFKKFFK